MAQNQVESSTEQQEESLHISQSMIDVYSQRLIGLRTQCATSAELTQQEIRSLEGKLIKMFSNQLALKAELRRKNGNKEVLTRYERIPNLEQWLQVVGLRQESVTAVCERVGSLEELQEKGASWDEVVGVLTERKEELDRLCRALNNLRRYTAILQDGVVCGALSSECVGSQAASGSNISLLECGQQVPYSAQTPSGEGGHGHSGSVANIAIPPLYWDSWDRRKEHHGAAPPAGPAAASSSTTSSPRPSRPRPAYRASIPNEESHPGQYPGGAAAAANGVVVLVVPASAPAACDRQAAVEGASAGSPPPAPLCNGGGAGGISGSVSSSALYCGGSVKSPTASPVSPTFGLTRRPPGLSNCRTPPACRKNTCNLPGGGSVLPPLCGTPTSLDFPAAAGPLTKSKSHESQLAADPASNAAPPSSPKQLDSSANTANANTSSNSNEPSCPAAVGALSSPLLRRERLPTEPGPEYGSAYDVAQLLDVQHLQQHTYRQVHVSVVQGDAVGVGATTLASQTAPPSPRVLRHRIAHRFQKTFKMMASCAVCLKPIYFGTGLRCKECKYRCHRDCEDRAAPSCGLTPELLKAVKDEARGSHYPGGANAATTSSGNCLPNRRKNSAPPSQMMYNGGGGGGHAGYPHHREQQMASLKDHQFGGSGSFLSNLLNHSKHKHIQQLLPAASAGGGGAGKPPPPQQQQQQQQQSSQSSTTNSSCNSSAPSSPAPVLAANGMGTAAPPLPAATRSSFHFPDPAAAAGCATTLLDHLQLLDRTNATCEEQLLQYSNGSSSAQQQQLLQHSAPPLSPLPARVDSQDSQMSSDTDTLMDGGGAAPLQAMSAAADSAPTSGGGGGNQRQNSMTTALKEWDIPFSELTLEGAGPLGAGRFGTVWRGQWHGDVAIKILHGQDEARTLQQFRSDVSTFRKTRHENLVLFMGACTRPPHLAIVTSLCKGQTLHSLVHLRRERFSLARAAAVAQQTSQGMGYLHAKGILHKDLTSKNVFLENQGTKVVITDFGLFSGLRNDRGVPGAGSCTRLAVPPGWLCYLAPELVRALTPTAPASAAQQQQPALPFSRAADVFAFGTLWFELLCGDWPFRGEPPEAVIWQVGAGRKVSLTNLHATKDVKDVLMACWAYSPTDREDFAQLLERLRRLPTAKRLARSPSHPVHLSRSAESVF